MCDSARGRAGDNLPDDAAKGIGLQTPLGIDARAGDWPSSAQPSSRLDFGSAGLGSSSDVWRNWLAQERASLSDEAYMAATVFLDQLATSELVAFRRAARQVLPMNQVLCAATGARSFDSDEGLCAVDLASREPALVRVPRVVGHALALRDAPGSLVMEEGLVSLRAHGAAPWHADFMACRAAARGWQSLWVSGQARFRRDLIAAARRYGLEAASYDACLDSNTD